MKSKVIGTLALAIFAIMLSVTNVSAADTTTGSAIAIDETNFPDAIFREYVSTSFDTEGDVADGYLSETEIASVSTIDVTESGVASLTGIEYFVELINLRCAGNSDLTSIDVSNNEKLLLLRCENTGISEADVSKNLELKTLTCYNTLIKVLDVSNNVALIELNCSDTVIEVLDVSNNTALTSLNCQNTSVSELDVSANTALERLYCSGTKIAELDVSSNTALTRLYCFDMAITELDVSNNTALTHLQCNNNLIGTLDVSNNTALINLYCGNTGITELDVSNNVALEKLSCGNNALTSLDVSKNVALTYLSCNGNKLTSIDISANTAIENFSATGNVFDIGEIGCAYNLSNIKNLDLTKTSEWINATYEDGKLTGFARNGAVTVYYTYDCGNNQTVQFRLTGTYTGEHNYVDNVCTDCGIVKGQGNIELGEEWVEIKEGAEDDGQVHMITYTINDANGEAAGTVELRCGGEGHTRIWITTGEVSEELEPHCMYSNTLFAGIESATWKEYFPGDAYTYILKEDKILDEIDGSGNIAWDEASKPGVLIWSHSGEAEKYLSTLYRDGKHVISSYSSYRQSNNSRKIDFADDINESGTYTVTVVLQGGKSTGNSKVITSNEYVYVKPEEELAITDKVWWTAAEGETLPTIINWNPVAGAGGYKVMLIPSEGRVSYSRTIYNTKSEFNTFEDWSGTIERLNEEAGKELTYTCTIRSLAGDIEVVANSSLEDIATSGDYVLAKVVEEEIKEAFDNSTADTIIDDIKDVGVDNMADAMQNNQELLDKVEDLEQDYADKNDIEVLPPAVDHPDVEQEDIKVVGAGLNAEAGKTITLAFAKLDKNDEVKVNNKLYKNTVQVNISLKEEDVNVKGELKTPITITMKPPKGINLKKMVILHYLDDGSVEKIYPKVNDDGTITFSVTSFSTFAFANMVHYDENGGEELPDDDTSDVPTIPDDGNEGEPIGPGTPDDSDDDDDYTGGGSDDYEDRVYYTDVRDYVKSLWNGKEGWSKVDGKWYFFDNAGGLKSGWVQDTDSKWYYMDTEKASMVTGWVCSPESKLWYYMDNANGHMIENTWVLDNTTNRWYYLGSNGAMCTGWIFTDGAWYLLDKTGAMCTSWNMVDGHWYLMNEKGIMLTGWQTVNGKEYYLVESGECLVNTTTPDGHKVDENGAKTE